jgi:hypothetical protein
LQWAPSNEFNVRSAPLFTVNSGARVMNADHIKAFRLFELSRAESVGKDFQLEPWEEEHLQDCAECRGVVEIFRRQFEGRPSLLPDRSGPPAGTQRFNVGDQVKVIGPGDHTGNLGVVSRVVNPTTGDFVYRYQVHFLDGGSHTFFGFEIQLITTS